MLQLLECNNKGFMLLSSNFPFFYVPNNIRNKITFKPLAIIQKTVGGIAQNDTVALFNAVMVLQVQYSDIIK